MRKGQKKRLDILKKSKTKFFLPKTATTIPLYDLLIEIDFFLDRVKKSDIPDEEKSKVLNGFKKLTINLSETFKKLSEKYNIPFNEPFDITMFRDDLKK